ncbi:MAG TPA: sporulation protein YhbH [Bacilli bacterium]
MPEPLFIISREDWSLHRKGHQDQMRHNEKIREAIKKNLPDLVSEENIILSSGKRVVKIPIRSLDEYRFRYNFNKSRHIGQGDGESKVGDVLATDSAPASGDASQGAGDQPGIDILEADVTLAEIEELVFAELELPNLQEKQKHQLYESEIRFNDVRKKGLIANIDKKRTILANIRRNARDGHPQIGRISPEDLRFKTWEETIKPHSNAVILAMMDTSGSMGDFEKYIARSFFFWMTRFLRKKYEHVEIVFIAHHTEANEVSEDEFFHRGESGGTICSSAYQKALEIIAERFPPEAYNIYPFHFSDGDNLTSDNERCQKLIGRLLEASSLFGYGEVNQYNRTSTLMNAFQHISHPRFKTCVIREKREVYKAMLTFFGKGKSGSGSAS